MLLDATRIRQMTDEVAVQLVNFGTAQNVKLLAPKAKHLVTRDHRDMDAFTIQYVAIHDRSPTQEPRQRLRSLAGDSEKNRALFPLRLQSLDRNAQPHGPLQKGRWCPSGLLCNRIQIHGLGHFDQSPIEGVGAAATKFSDSH
jgi:hypothetical protein